MPRHPCWILMLAAVACRPAPKAAPPANDPADVAAVEQVLTRWYDAFERHDSAGVAAPLLPTFFIFEDTTRIGRDDLIAGMVGGFSQGNQTAALSDFATEVRGDVAWTSFRNREVWTPADGSPSDTLDFLESVVFEKRDGVWLMERYHATRINRPAPPA